MSAHTLAAEFVALCNQGKNFDVMRAMYAENIVSVEGDGKETVGKGPVIHKSEVWAGENTIHGGKAYGPYFSGASQFAVRFVFEVTRKDTHERVTLEEVGVYTVENEKITREQFFYEGKH